MISTAALNQDIMGVLEGLPSSLDAASLAAVESTIQQFDPARHQGAMAELLWDLVGEYRSSEHASYVQTARRLVAHGLHPDHMVRNNRCAYQELYQVLILPPDRQSPVGINEVFGLYGDIIGAEHAIKGDPRGGYGALHFLVMLHKDHPAHTIDMLGRAIATGFPVDHTDNVQETPLLALLSRGDYPGRIEMVRALLDAGANPMLTSSGGRSCWFCAAEAAEPFELLDLLAAHTPHARAHGDMGADEIQAILASATASPRGASIQGGDRVEVWVHDRLMRQDTPTLEAAKRAGPRL